MPTYLNSNKFPLSRCGDSGATSQIPCPLIYEHIKSCIVCQQAVKNTCSSLTHNGTVTLQATTIDKNTLVLYGIFLLFIIILIVIMFKH